MKAAGSSKHKYNSDLIHSKKRKKQLNYGGKQNIFAYWVAMIKETEKFEPRIVGFLCNWCSYAGADLAGTSKLKVPSSLTPIRVMCSSRVDPVLVTTAFLRGADGVLVTGCHPGDCHYDDGNYYARRRFAVLKKVVEGLGLESDRLRLSWVSASEGQRFADVVSEFNDKIKKMGPNPLRKKVSL